MINHKSFNAIFRRELSSYFNSPIAYIFIVVFVMLMSSLFMSHFFLVGQANMRYFFDLLPFALCVFIPAITMRSWAEEKKGNTFELLLTFPIKAHNIILGKFCAGFIFYIITLAGTLFIPVMLLMLGNPDMGVILGGYIGALLLGALFLSVGIFISGLCRDQIVALVLSMVVSFVMYLIGLDFIASTIDGWLPGIGTFLQHNFGVTTHYLRCVKGVLSGVDVIYFVVMTVVFLILNNFSVEDRMRPKAKILLSMAMVLSLLVSGLLNSLLGDMNLMRFDLTESKLFTVTDATKRILNKVEAPLSLKVYISPQEKMPTAYQTLEQNIKDKLDELKSVSNGNLDFQIVHIEAVQGGDPTAEEGNTDEKVVLRKGIRPFQVRSVEQDELDIKLIYSSIAIAYKDKDEEIIPQIVPENLSNLEYEVATRVFRMTLDELPKVVLVAPFRERDMDPQLRQVLAQFGQVPEQLRDDDYQLIDQGIQQENYAYQRIRLSKDEPIPEDTDTLVVMGQDRLSDRQLYEINRFLVEGGNVIMAAHHYNYEYQQRGRGLSFVPQRIPQNLNRILVPHGISINPHYLMDENHEVVNINSGGGPFARSVPVKAPMHILVKQENMNSDMSITSRLPSLFSMWASALTIEDDVLLDKGLTYRTLFTSSEQSWEVQPHNEPLSPYDITRPNKLYEGKKTLAVMVEGQFEDIFKDRDVPPWPGDKKIDEILEETDDPKPIQPGKLIVVGSSKMFESAFVRVGGNLAFLINSIDALSLGSDLIEIRGHRPIDRRIEKVSRTKKLAFRFMTIFLVPMIVIIVGGLRAMLRQKEKKAYLSRLKSGRNDT